MVPGKQLTHLIALCMVGAMVTLTSGLQGTPRNLDQIIIGRCEEYQRAIRPDLFKDGYKNCTELWLKFHKAFAYTAECNVTVESYKEFVDAAFHKFDTENKVMYWSGVSLPMLVNYARTNSAKYVTIREILAAYVIRNVDQWCGQVSSPGVNYNKCPSWGNTCSLLASTSFWTALSKSFAQQVKGTVHLMLNGSTGQAYRNTSIFAHSELKNLDKSRTPGVHVHLVYAVGGPIKEKCGMGTLDSLRKDVQKKGMTYKCSDDDLDIVYFQCITEMGTDRCKRPGSLLSGSVVHVPSVALLLLLLTITIAKSFFSSRLMPLD